MSRTQDEKKLQPLFNVIISHEVISAKVRAVFETLMCNQLKKNKTKPFEYLQSISISATLNVQKLFTAIFTLKTSGLLLIPKSKNFAPRFEDYRETRKLILS